jgi:hypothetical protein
MTIRLQSKQIDKWLSASVFIRGYAQPASATSNVTAALTSAFSTASNAGTAIPLQDANTVLTDPQGVLVSAGRNRVEVWNGATVTVSQSGTSSIGSATITGVAATAGIVVGMFLSTAYQGIPAGATVVSFVANTSVTFSANATAAGTAAFTVQTADGESKFQSVSGAEVFGELTSAAGVYTLTLWSIESGIRTQFVPATAITVDMALGYLFSFENLPADSLSGGTSRFVSQDVTPTSRVITELLAVTAVNTLAARSTAAKAGGAQCLIINGQSVDALAPFAFTMAGTATTWNAVNAGYSLVPGVDRVIARYEF